MNVFVTLGSGAIGVALMRARITAIRLPLTNANARAEREWRPAFPTIRDGLSQTLGRAA
jgi:hypothetical protein